MDTCNCIRNNRVFATCKQIVSCGFNDCITIITAVQIWIIIGDNDICQVCTIHKYPRIDFLQTTTDIY